MNTTDWQAEAEAAALLAGFEAAACAEWNWKVNPNIVIDTQTAGRIGHNGILIVRVVADGPANSVTAQLSVAPFPGTQEVNWKRLTISTAPADQYPTEPMSVWQGLTPKAWFCVGPSPLGPKWAGSKPLAYSMTPGGVYYINVSERDKHGNNTCVGGECELRAQLRSPRA